MTVSLCRVAYMHHEPTARQGDEAISVLRHQCLHMQVVDMWDGEECTVFGVHVAALGAIHTPDSGRPHVSHP